MYESYYNIKEKPFSLTPDPDYFYMSRTHENAYTHLEYAISQNKGFAVVTGEIGAGKTILINFLLRDIQQAIHVGIVNHTNIVSSQFIKMVCKEFELEVDNMDKAEMLDAFHQFLLRSFAARKRVALIIDEAQNLPVETIEEIRMLSNLETEKHHLMLIILTGQPSLKYKLGRKDLEQFTQRVTVYCHLGALNPDEASRYIHHRLEVAGANSVEIFDVQAIESIYGYSHGIPRMINILCDAALVHGYAEDMEKIDRQVIEDIMETRMVAGFYADPPVDENALPSSKPSEHRTIDQLNTRVLFLESSIRMLQSNLAKMNLEPLLLPTQ